MARGLKTVPALDPALRRRIFPRTLRRFNDAMATTPLQNRCFVWGGLLLGWAREGAPLAHDFADADFLIRAEDEHLLEGPIAEPPVEPFQFLGRSWLKPKDHEEFLTSTYGDWRTPDPGWSSSDDPSIVASQPWSFTDTPWN